MRADAYAMMQDNSITDTPFMYVDGQACTTIWYDYEQQATCIIDQTQLPHRFSIIQLRKAEDFLTAISDMQVRGAPLIGATAAFGLATAIAEDPSPANESYWLHRLQATRPTAINLNWSLNRVSKALQGVDIANRPSAALAEAENIRTEDMHICETIGNHGLEILTGLWKKKAGQDKTLNILTHCNAGWLATVDWGTALAPIYKAHQAGIPVHVWVDETRPRNQGSRLTAWELQQQGIPHSVIVDNTGGHLMQQGMVDVCLVGSDRTTASGDVCNKIGTYLKALAAKDNHVPFFVALPTSSIDWTIDNGLTEIPIEVRDARELTHIEGVDKNNRIVEIQLSSHSAVVNYAFDVTPARLVDGLITEYGVYSATKTSLLSLKQLQEQSNE